MCCLDKVCFDSCKDGSCLLPNERIYKALEAHDAINPSSHP